MPWRAALKNSCSIFNLQFLRSLCCIVFQEEGPGKEIVSSGAGFGKEAACYCFVLCHYRQMGSQVKEPVRVWENIPEVAF